MSRSLHHSDVNVFFSHAYSEFGSGVGVLAFGGSAPSSVMLSIAGFQNGNYFYASHPYYLQHFSTLNFVPAGERMDLAWGYGYTNSQFLNTGGYLAFRYDVGAAPSSAGSGSASIPARRQTSLLSGHFTPAKAEPVNLWAQFHWAGVFRKQALLAYLQRVHSASCCDGENEIKCKTADP